MERQEEGRKEGLWGKHTVELDNGEFNGMRQEKCPVCNWAFLVAQMVKNLPAMQETWVQSLSWEDLLKKEMATHHIPG